jgi:PKD repeat protein
MRYSYTKKILAGLFAASLLLVASGANAQSLEPVYTVECQSIGPALCYPNGPNLFPGATFIVWEPDQIRSDPLYGISANNYVIIDLVFADGVNQAELSGGFRLVGLVTEPAGSSIAPIEADDIEYLGEWASVPSSIPFVAGDPGDQTLEWTSLQGAAPIGADAIIRINLRFDAGDGQGNLPPDADANGPYTGTAGVAVDFDGTASTDTDGSITTWNWDFGDGAKGSGETTSHTYSSADIWNVTLTVIDGEGATASDTTRAFIDQAALPPQADALGPYPDNEAKVVYFNGSLSVSSNPGGSIVRYDWDYGDGTVGLDAGPIPNHTYPADGLYEVTLTVEDERGATDEDTTWAVVGFTDGDPPVANAGGPYTGVLGAAITFDGTASDDPDGEIVSWAWDFGDEATGSGETTSHTYTANGTYNVVLLVEDEDGRIDSNKTTATIGTGNLPPVTDASGPYAGTAGVAVNFDGTASIDPEGNAMTWAWDFGDGNSGSGETTSHTYSSEGLYFVTLTVTDSDGATDSDVTLATISSTGFLPAVYLLLLLSD